MTTLAVDYVVTRDTIVWGFGPDMEPVLEVEPGAVVRFETNDCFTGQIQNEDDLVTDIDFARVNGATGPVAVRGAEPGDSLVVELLEVNPGPTGFATLIPGFGQLIEQVRSPLTRVFRVDDGTIHMNERVSFPLRPMVGVVGVATDGEEITNGWAGRHGGNLDNHLHGPGARMYFPVRQPGGLFAVGDMHASMGDGEICGTGVEIAGEVVARFDVLKGSQATWPVTELADAWVAHATSGGDFTEAMSLAIEEAARLLVDQWDFTLEDAFVFLSVACDVGICQACQPSPFSAIARVKIPRLDATPRPFRRELGLH
jgi:amidase